MSMQLVTKDSLIRIYTAWEVEAEIPKKGKKTVICFSPAHEFRMVEVTKTDKKSTGNKALYQIEFKN